MNEVERAAKVLIDEGKTPIRHLVLGVEWWKSGEFYNEATLNYLKKILDANVFKKPFDIYEKLKEFVEVKYPLYLRFKQRPKNLTLKRVDDSFFIDCDKEYEISNPLFNAMGDLLTNPSFEIVEKKEKIIVTIEAAEIQDDESLKIRIDRDKGVFLEIIGLKKSSTFSDEEDNKKVFSGRKSGPFQWK